MKTEGKVLRLTSAEITSLWTSYINDTALKCQFKYFSAIVEDEEIRPLIRQAVDLAEGNIKTIKEIFNKEKYPIPYGFKENEDVDLSATRLYSDTYVLHYLHHAAQIALQAYCISLSLAARADVYSYYNECISQLTSFLRKAKEILLSKGIYIRSPFLPIPDSVDFVKSQSFLTGYLGERRPLLGTEITNLFANFERNAFGVATMIGFSQVAQSKEVSKFLVRGKEIAKKHCEIFGLKLKENDIPVPMSWDTEVSGSTNYTFSDKLMMFYSTSLIALSVGYYGSSMAMSPRKDIGVMYSKLSGELLKYAEDGANILIKNGWMEEPPRALDREELSKTKE